MKSQYARFKADFPSDPEFDDPPGAWLANHLSGHSSQAGWQVSEIENWRDGGWSVACSKSESKLEFVVLRGKWEWFLQVYPLKDPGFLRRWFGAVASATPAEVVSLSREIHRVLTDYERVSNLRWRIDGDPDGEHSTPEPMLEIQE
jgi:hypothetical protein